MLIHSPAHPAMGLKLPQFSFRGDHAPFGRFSPQSNGQSTFAGNIERMASLLESQLQRSLGSAAPVSPVASPATDTDLSPQAVADRVLGFIEQALQQFRESGASDVEIQHRLAAAREGVERGFREAKQLLQDEGRFQGEVADNAVKTRDLIQQGIDELEGQLLGAQAAATENFKAAGYSRFSLRESVALQVRTQEGDVVTVKLRRSASSREAYRIESDERGYSLDYQASNAARAKLSVKVEGDLNADEQAALSELLSDVDGLAERFFAGNLDAAFQEAQALSFDQEELAGFSLHLRQKATARVAAYQEVGSLLPSAGNNAKEALPPGVARGLNDLGQREDLRQALPEVKALGESLFAQRLQLDERFDALRAALDEVTNRLLDAILALQPVAEPDAGEAAESASGEEADQAA